MNVVAARSQIRVVRSHKHVLTIEYRTAGAFTLVELLVVISIVALLLAISLPALGAARLQAQTMVCASNLRQIYYACFAYGQEHQDRLPPKFEVKKKVLSLKEIAEGKALNQPDRGIQTVLEPYASLKVFQSPGDIGSFGDITPMWKRIGTSYDVKGIDAKKSSQKPQEASFWHKLNKGDDIATHLFKPWDAADLVKVQDKIKKGEWGPVSWLNGQLNMVLADGRVVTVRTKAQEKTAKGDDAD